MELTIIFNFASNNSTIDVSMTPFTSSLPAPETNVEDISITNNINLTCAYRKIVCDALMLVQLEIYLTFLNSQKV